MEKYNPARIEKKWQERWESRRLYAAKDKSKKPKFYLLDMFPYPSGEGLHVGHVEGYTATDIIARYKRMKGFNVLHPMGWDAFGLPAENYAVKTKIHPQKTTEKAIGTFRKQIKSLGLSYDWGREIGTHTPEYYRFTQWFFLLLYKNGLAYKKLAKVNWCESCKTVLANEQVEDGRCERCKNEVVQKDLEQWFFKITDFAEELVRDLDSVDWPASTVSNQRNWIGRSEGAEIDFPVKLARPARSETQSQAQPFRNARGPLAVSVFTTRPDTLFGATYLVLAPEHPLVETLAASASNKKEVLRYIVQTKKRTELERAGAKEKTGVEIKGVKAVNSATKEEVPIFVADYVLPHYGTGAVMAVPAHDERDFAFAQRFKLPMRQVVMPAVTDPANPPRSGKENTKREIVHCIVLHPTEKKFIALKHKTQPWLTPVTGGIEGGESVVDGALREIKEETGYRHPVFLEELPYVINAKFFAAHKNVNRDVVAHILKFKLKDLARTELSAEEKAKHEVVWLPLTELHTLHPVSELDHIVSWFRSGATAYTGEGILTNSGAFSGLESETAKRKITEAVGGRWMVTYKLRDWLVSRQRYWGAPIPIIYCDACGTVPVPEKDLPVLLPKDVDFMPTGESPLLRSKSFQNVRCPSCGGKARRESDTMDTFVCSSWYYFRFADPKNKKAFAGKERINQWLPVDLYVGGAEHTVLHLMYARFFTKVLRKLGYVPFREPFAKLRHQGLILAEDGRKMSKSLGNVVNPDSIVKTYGADTLRLYEMFMGPLQDAKPWDAKSIVGVRRFLERVWRLSFRVENRRPNEREESALHRAIGKVGEDIEDLKFNTAISAMMICVGELEAGENVSAEAFDAFLLLLAPFAPHLAEELSERRGKKRMIAEEPWPVYDPTKRAQKTQTIVVEVNGKVRGTFAALAGASEREVTAAAGALPAVAKWLAGKGVKKTIFVPGRLVNFVLLDSA